MQIDQREYEEVKCQIEENLSQQLKEETQKGTPKDYFLSYSNILRELLPLSLPFDYKEILKNYRRQVMIEDWYKDKVGTFSAPDGVVGFEKLMHCMNEGGIIFSFHYGNYRSVYDSIFDKMYEIVPEKKIMMVVDKPSYDLEPSKYMSGRNLKYTISQDVSIGFEIVDHIMAGNWLAIFLDGNTGVGKDRSPIELDFLSSKVHIRSGIFRILTKLGKPVIPVMAEGNVDSQKFHIYDNVNINGSPEQLANRCYDILRKKALEAPQYWRFWYKHETEVVQWKPIHSEKDPVLSEIFMPCVDGKLRIDENTGKIYKVSL